MATTDAKRAYEKWKVRVVFGDGKRRFWDPVFEHNPKIAKDLKPGERFAWVSNFPGHRPYISSVTQTRFLVNPDFRVEPGEVFLTQEELVLGQHGCVVIEPTVKTKYESVRQFDIGRNKEWPWERWEEIVKLPLPWVQLGPEDTKPLGVRRFVTRTFREALGAISGADLVVTTDGALMHAAAALGVPAVVLFGGFMSPENMGYEAHKNVWNGASPCGTHTGICQHCRDAMESITVEQVKSAIDRVVC
jgi:hypothetical protein